MLVFRNAYEGGHVGYPQVVPPICAKLLLAAAGVFGTAAYATLATVRHLWDSTGEEALLPLRRRLASFGFCSKGTRSMAWRRVLLLMLALLLFTANAQAEDKEPTAIVELGVTGEWGLPGSSSFGPSLAGEFTPIKDWLEIEAGVGPMFHDGRTEWDTDFLFKKPFTLSDKVEFMVGVGPQWTFSREGSQIGGEFALDFMFWPTSDRKYGWFLEPTYNYSFSSGHEQSIGATIGLLIPIP